MLLKAYNRALIQDRERTYLSVAGVASDTSISVSTTDLAPAATSSDTWTDNDYMILGEIGQEGTEIMQVNGAVTSASSITIDRSGQAGGLRYAHPVGTPIYRIDYNRVEFSRNTTDSTSGVSVLTTIRIQPDDEFTRYEDTTNTTGYGFARFNNESSGAFSSYSDGVNYESSGQSSSRDPRTLWSMRNKVRKLLDELTDSKVKDQDIDDALNDKQRDIAHRTLWSFYEKEKSFSAVADQFLYAIPSTAKSIYAVRFDTQPLAVVNRAKWDMLNWDSNTSVTKPTHLCIWDNNMLIWPRPSTAAATTTLNGGITATVTSMTVVSTSSFNRGDYYRVIIDSEVIYATASTSTTLTGLLRGQEGTTAASHLTAATVTERDIVYTLQEEPTDLLDTQDRTAIPEPDALTYGAATDLAMLINKTQVYDRLLPLSQVRMKQLENKYAVKHISQFGRVHDMYEMVSDNSHVSNPNLYPRDIG